MSQPGFGRLTEPPPRDALTVCRNAVVREPVKRINCLVAIMDWASRYVLAWRLSNTPDARFCTDALEEALAAHGAPEIFNTDQRTCGANVLT